MLWIGCHSHLDFNMHEVRARVLVHCLSCELCCFIQHLRLTPSALLLVASPSLGGNDAKYVYKRNRTVCM